ncbi:uroporphyrinogen-III C-methyltransferase [Limnobacter humi]|uniref:Uroporphyrinogen-III C-methyltransferase n=2 Tax=Limnobacter humi TaxID=1778671 RepID=A0ABT1WEX2_9BURK|nr:uroporphyrinogen-III C-methyltransferase [Limnobacter humi]
MDWTLVVCKPKLPDGYSVQKSELDEQLTLGNQASVLNLPVFELVPHTAKLTALRDWMAAPRRRFQKMVVFVSPSALEMAMTHVTEWPADLMCGVMGRQSARLAQRMGIPRDHILAPSVDGGDDTEDSAGLLALMCRHFADKALEVLVCKGPRGRVDFPQKLSELGHDVDILEIYDRLEIQQSSVRLANLLTLGGRCVLWITSSETAEALDRQMSQMPDHQLLGFKNSATVLTTHNRITRRCKELGYARVVEIPTGIQSVNLWLKTNTTAMTGSSMTNPVSSQSANATAYVAQSQPNITQPAVNPWLVKLAFLLSLASMALVLLISFAGKNQIEKTRLAFGERIQKESTTLDLVREQMTQYDDLTRDLKTRFELLEEAQKEEASQRVSLEEVYNNLLASKTEVSLSEVDQLISIAKRQLYLLGNVNGAAVALGQAIDLLEKAEKPSLMNLRTALQTDLAAIKALPSDDLLKLAIALDSVINSVETMPSLAGADATTQTNLAKLNNPERIESEPAVAQDQTSTPTAGTAESSAPQFSWAGAWSFVKTVASTAWYDIQSLIEITKVDTPDVLLLSSRQEADVRNALRLSLLNARVTMLSRQGELLKSDLNRSLTLINTYFDTKNPQVERAVSVLNDINKIQVDLVLPELKATTSAYRLAVAGQQQKGSKP